MSPENWMLTLYIFLMIFVIMLWLNLRALNRRMKTIKEKMDEVHQIQSRLFNLLVLNSHAIPHAADPDSPPQRGGEGEAA